MSDIRGKHDDPATVAPVYTARVHGSEYSSANYQVVDSVALARLGVVAQSDVIYIPEVGEFKWNPTSTATDDGAKVIQITGVATGRYEYVFRTVTVITAEKFATGGTGTSADPWTGWATAIPWANNLTVQFGVGVFSFSASPTLGQYRHLSLIGQGTGATTLRYTGTGNAIECHEEARTGVVFPWGFVVEGFRLEGNAAMQDGISLMGAHNFALRDITFHDIADACVRTQWCVTGNCVRLHYRADDETNTVVPAYGMVLDGGLPTRSAWQTTTVECIDCHFCQVQTIGLHLKSCFGVTFVGGAFEAGTGANVTTETDAHFNTFIGTDFEASTSECVIDGTYNKFVNAMCVAATFVLRGNNNEFDGSVAGVRDEGVGNIYHVKQISNFENASTAVTSDFKVSYKDTTVGAAQQYLTRNHVGSIAAQLPKNCLVRVHGTVSCYCTAGPSIGDGHSWKIDKTGKIIENAGTELFDNGDADTPPHSWDLVCTISSGYFTLLATGSADDSLTWFVELKADMNGGGGVALTPTQRIVQVVDRLGGFWWATANATVGGSGMSIVDACGNVNALAVSSGRSPTIGTLADLTTPAIVCPDKDRCLLPTATLGTATSHTLIWCGEPDNTTGSYYFARGSVSGPEWSCALDASGTVRITVSSSYGSAAVAAGLQLLEYSVDDAGNTAATYRNGALLTSTTCAVAPVMATYTSCGFLGFYDSTGYGSKGAFTDLIYIPGAISANERAFLYKSIKSLRGLP